MKADADLHRRLDAMAARAAVDQEELEDLLTEGYARALAREAESRHLGNRLAELVVVMDEQDAAREARRLALRRRTVDNAVAELRERLATVRATATVRPRSVSRST